MLFAFPTLPQLALWDPQHTPSGMYLTNGGLDPPVGILEGSRESDSSDERDLRGLFKQARWLRRKWCLEEMLAQAQVLHL